MAATDDLSRGGSPGNVCPQCGASFVCGMNAGQARCWCAELPRHLPVPDLPAGASGACLCPACLRALVSDDSGGPAPG